MTEKIPMNLLPKQSESLPTNNPAMAEGDVMSGLDLRFLTGELSKNSLESRNGDDSMVDISDDKSDDSKLCISLNSSLEKEEIKEIEPDKVQLKLELKPMNDIIVKLESIKPSAVPPLMVLEEKNGISVTLHFAKDKPREDIQVIVVTTISKNSLPLSNYLFQGVVPKVCIFERNIFVFEF